jgi:O-acetyl-ADP-ribose deacetylase (regulator of RNase III)
MGEPRLLVSCYRKSLELALEKGCKTVAFPSISCGVYGYPVEKAARIAVKEVSDFLKEHEEMEKVYLVCFSDDIFKVYSSVMDEILS